MQSHNNCKYCNFIKNQSTELYNKILVETDNFIVTPSLGSLIPGWQLVIPKKHYLNVSQIGAEEKAELLNLLEQQINITSSSFKKEVAIFEHGAVNNGSLVGCGIDHAHIHIVPLDFNIGLAAKNIENTFAPTLKHTSILDFYRNNENLNQKPYWVCATNYQNIYYTEEMSEASQFFRRVIADKLSIGDKFDYKKHSFNENIAKTVDELTPKLINMVS